MLLIRSAFLRQGSSRVLESARAFDGRRVPTPQSLQLGPVPIHDIPQVNTVRNAISREPPAQTRQFAMTQTMLRVRDPDRSVTFYRDVLGMTLLNRFDFPAMKVSLYFFGYVLHNDPRPPKDRLSRAEYTFRQRGAIELTHKWGTESDAAFSGYHNGNSEPRGFGHIGITVPDVDAACAWFEENGVDFVKRPGDGTMKGLAFIKDPDGYWIEILAADVSARLVAGL